MYLCHIYNVSSLEWTYGTFGTQGVAACAERDKQMKWIEYNYNFIAILTLSAIISKCMV